MKKIAVLLLLVLVLAGVGCQKPITELPKTNIEKFKTSTGFSFPRGTTTLDIYNCLMSSNFSEGKNTITGNAVFELNNIKKSVELKEVFISVTTISDVHSYTLTFMFTPVKINDVTFNSKSFLYQWQYTTKNTWANEILSDNISLAKP